MEKKLPGVFVNRINKKLTNNESVFYDRNANVNKQVIEKKSNIIEKSVNDKINSIFASDSYVYKMEVIIKLKDKTLTKKIIGRNREELITIDSEVIKIDDIVDIYPKK